MSLVDVSEIHGTTSNLGMFFGWGGANKCTWTLKLPRKSGISPYNFGGSSPFLRWNFEGFWPLLPKWRGFGSELGSGLAEVTEAPCRVRPGKLEVRGLHRWLLGGGGRPGLGRGRYEATVLWGYLEDLPGYWGKGPLGGYWHMKGL